MKKLWAKEKWREFSERVKSRDDYKCLQCARDKTEVTLQVHHELYIRNKAPWEYSLSDCRTLCKGCHAKEHSLIEPDKGWYLLSIEDLGDLIGTCERINCGNSIRYEHHTYHPNWGYKIVGSTCIEHLTQEDRLLSHDILKLYKQISKFIHNSTWSNGFTQKGKKFIYTTYKHHQIRIYGDKNYNFQVALKEKGVRWFDFQKPVNTRNKSLEEVKELAFIVLKGTITNDKKEKELLRGLYRNINNT